MRRLAATLRSRSPEFAFALLVLLGSSAAALAAAAAGWPGAPNDCLLAGDCYCEAVRRGRVAQPVNTGSLVLFSLAGLAVAWHAGRRRRHGGGGASNRFTGTAFYPALYAGVLTFMGPAGIVFHASLTDWGGAVDVLAMFLWIDFLILYDLSAVRGWGRGRFLAVYLPGTALLALPRFLHGPAGVPLFAVAFMGWLLLELALARGKGLPNLGRPVQRDRRWLVAFLATNALAFALWLGSHEGGPLCAPDSLLQGHAAWHVLNAIAAFFLYPYLRSERPAGRAPPPST